MPVKCAVRLYVPLSPVSDLYSLASENLPVNISALEVYFAVFVDLYND